MALIAALLVAGCASQPAPVSERHAVPRERIASSALLSPSAERPARFTVTRDAGYVGSLAGIDVFVDGQRVARVAKAESVTVYVTPGRHLVGVRFSWGPVAPTEREFIADPQRPSRIRITTDQNANLDLKPESGSL